MSSCTYDCECSICLDSLDHTDDTTTLICNHKFHTECINQWTKIRNMCPYCRKFLSESYKAKFKIYKLFLSCEVFIETDTIIVKIFIFNRFIKNIILEKTKIKSISVINKILLIIYHNNKKDISHYIKFNDKDMTFMLFNHIQNFFRSNN